MVTASHNPIEHNGFKLIDPGARALSDAELRSIEAIVAAPPRGARRSRRGHDRTG